MNIQGVRQSIVADDADMSGSSFTRVSLARSTFTDMKMSDCALTNVNLRGVTIENADLAHVAIADCAIEGMTFDGVSVSEMMAAYRARNPTPRPG